MELINKDTHYILFPNTPVITDKIVCDMFREINEIQKPVVINLEGVEDCVSDFFRMFEMFSNITLLNTESKLLSILYLTGFDKFVTIYGDDLSLDEKKRELKNRRLKLL